MGNTAVEAWEKEMAALQADVLFSSLDLIELKFTDDQTWDVYVAMDPASRARGLAGVPEESLDADGMLFYFPQPSWVPFTAADMLFDMYINWYDDAGAIIQREFVPAGQRSPLCSPKSFTWVLESNRVPPGSDLKVNRGA